MKTLKIWLVSLFSPLGALAATMPEAMFILDASGSMLGAAGAGGPWGARLAGIGSISNRRLCTSSSSGNAGLFSVKDRLRARPRVFPRIVLKN